jgi:hypothetical protein
MTVWKAIQQHATAASVTSSLFDSGIIHDSRRAVAIPDHVVLEGAAGGDLLRPYGDQASDEDISLAFGGVGDDLFRFPEHQLNDDTAVHAGGGAAGDVFGDELEFYRFGDASISQTIHAEDHSILPILHPDGVDAPVDMTAQAADYSFLG